MKLLRNAYVACFVWFMGFLDLTCNFAGKKRRVEREETDLIGDRRIDLKMYASITKEQTTARTTTNTGILHFRSG